MEQPVNFARHFAHLVWLLLYEPASIDEQKAALRALVAASRGGAVHLGIYAEAVQANEFPMSTAFTGIADMATQMALHGLSLVTADANAKAADLLNVARILAGMPTRGDGGAAAEARRLALSVTTLRFAARPQFSSEAAPIPEMEFGDVLDDPVAEARSRATPRSMRALEEQKSSAGGGGALYAQFSAPSAPTESHEDLLAKLDTEVEPNAVARLLDDLTVLAEGATKRGQAPIATEILGRVVRREREHEVFDTKRLFAMTVKRMGSAATLRAVAQQLPRDTSDHAALMGILARAGDDGAEVLVEQLGEQSQQRDRRYYYDALIALRAGVQPLLHMLSDARWFAARNAAELLGEMRVNEAESGLNALLHHDDERVRRAATSSLMRLGTPQAMQAIQHALASATARMRMDAAAALAARRDATSVAMLLRALDVEREPDVQAAFLLSLGKLATPDAVERIQRAAAAERTLFKRKSGELRIAAVQALSEARTPEALSALRMLQGDKEQSVRDAATLALSRVARRTVAVPRLPLDE